MSETKTKEFECEITSGSENLTAHDRIKIRLMNCATPLDEIVTSEEVFKMRVDKWAVLHVHNEKLRDRDSEPDYDSYVFIDENGKIYTTSSGVAYKSFRMIVDECETAGINDYNVLFYKTPSKNYKGKFMMNCTIE